MKRFHISPRTGSPNICRAQPGHCPFGDESTHYPSEAEARAGFEKQAGEAHLAGLSKPESKLEEYTVASRPDLFPETTRGLADLSIRIDREKFEKDNPERRVDCPKCGERIGGPSEASFLSVYGYTLQCYNCEHTVGSDGFDLPVIRVNPDSPTAKAESPQEITKMVWYHWTSRKDWHETLGKPDGPAKVHVGGENAAADRSMNLGPANGRLYVISIDPSATVREELGADGDQDFAVDDSVQEDVARYVNRWEDPGSISLLVNPGKLRVQGYTEYSVEDSNAAGTYHVVGVEDYVTAQQEAANFA